MKTALLAMSIFFGSLYAAEDVKIVVFTMPGCSPCHELKNTLDAMLLTYGVVEDVEIARRDYQITEFPTVIVYVKDKEKTRFSGNKTKAELRLLLKQ